MVAWLWTTGGVVAVALGARLWAQRSSRHVDVAVATRPQPTGGGGGGDAQLMTFSRLVGEEGPGEPTLVGRAELRRLFFHELDQQQWTFQVPRDARVVPRRWPCAVRLIAHAWCRVNAARQGAV
jgi:hypothetical protein